MADPLDPIVTDDTDVISRVLSVSPAGVTDGALDALIAKLRQNRTLFIKVDANKGGPKDEEAPAIPETDQAPE